MNQGFLIGRHQAIELVGAIEGIDDGLLAGINLDPAHKGRVGVDLLDVEVGGFGDPAKCRKGRAPGLGIGIGEVVEQTRNLAHTEGIGNACGCGGACQDAGGHNGGQKGSPAAAHQVEAAELAQFDGDGFARGIGVAISVVRGAVGPVPHHLNEGNGDLLGNEGEVAVLNGEGLEGHGWWCGGLGAFRLDVNRLTKAFGSGMPGPVGIAEGTAVCAF